MADLNDQLELARIAYDGENYSESYQKYSSTIDKDINNKTAWIGKGLSAGRKSTPDSNTLKEAKISLKKAKEFKLSDEEKSYIAKEILDTGKEFTKKTLSSVLSELTEKDKKPMATGELYAVRRVGQLADRFSAFNDHFEHFKQSVVYSRFALEFDESEKIYKGVLENVDLILIESDQNFHADLKKQILDWRKEIIKSVKEYEPDFQPKGLKKDNEGCFIATATYGSYNSRAVIELRDFRDSYLKRTKTGNTLIQLYYFSSPPFASLIEKSVFLKYISKTFIDKFAINIARLLMKIKQQ